MGAARLEVVAGNAAGTTILVEDELVIGRHAEGAGRLADDEEISRSHARVTLDASGFCAIEDLGSTNGTFVNGLRISAPQTLSQGDTIEVGGTTLIVRDLGRPEPEPEPVFEPEPEPVFEPEPEPGPEPEPTPTGRAESAARQPTIVSGGAPPPPPPLEPAAPATLSLQLRIDFAAREAWISLDGDSPPVRLVFDAGQWRAETPDDGERKPA